MKKWESANKLRVEFCNVESKFKVEELIRILLENRGIKTKKEIEDFFNPELHSVTAESVGIDKKQLKKALVRIKKAIKDKEQIVVFGDYDVDGVCSTAVLWETLYSLGASVVPYIPHRIDEGYGLSKTGISNLKSQKSNIKLIITVDNGIVANEAVEFAKKEGIDVIVTDHHVPSKELPKAYSIVHTTKVCGAGVAYLLAREIENNNGKGNMENGKHLELVALATIADMVPLTGVNRILVKYGLEMLKKTKRPGLLELFREAGLDAVKIGVYEIGHIIAPRINAMGRLEYAMDSLRILCTKDKVRAKLLAEKLGTTNRERQNVTEETVLDAKSIVRSLKITSKNKLIFISHESYQQGVIGLVAGQLVEEFYRPAIVVSKGEKYSKASARSIRGVNIVEFIRSASSLLVDVGGHPMAAGFTVETKNLSLLQKTLEEKAIQVIDEEKLTRVIKIDCDMPMPVVNVQLYDEIQKMAPFGMGNAEPVFMSEGVVIEDMRLVGREGKHVKLKIKYQKSNTKNNSQFSTFPANRDPVDNSQFFDAIAFGLGERSKEFHVGDKVDIVYTIDENVWNGRKSLQLKIKDLKLLS